MTARASTRLRVLGPRMPVTITPRMNGGKLSTTSTMRPDSMSTVLP